MPTFLLRAAIAATLTCAGAMPLAAQTTAMPESIVSIYRAAPGHQIQLLQWLAKQEETARAAGVGPSQLYVHQSGASWDFLLVQPATTPEQDNAVDAAAKRMGAAAGPKAGLEIRQHIAEHSDTRAAGPLTVADWLRRLEQ